ncbi:MAG: hypothetical protein F9K23_17035 [Bacteroidetes bacterium]|nr:MAG: hypothetical protein F9K23_17035 [Bacteroidota bacterium]
MKRLLNILAIIYKNRRTSFTGLVCAVATWFFIEKSITADQFLALMGFCNSLGLFLAKDGQTQTEYDKAHKTGNYTRYHFFK